MMMVFVIVHQDDAMLWRKIRNGKLSPVEKMEATIRATKAMLYLLRRPSYKTGVLNQQTNKQTNKQGHVQSLAPLALSLTLCLSLVVSISFSDRRILTRVCVCVCHHITNPISRTA
jgi:hypothetical protein